MPSVGHPVAFTPNPEHNLGTSPVSALVQAVHPDGTVDLTVFVFGREAPVHFSHVAQANISGDDHHVWHLPDLVAGLPKAVADELATLRAEWARLVAAVKATNNV